MAYKWCPHCKTSKKLDEFNRDRTRPLGLKSWCKICFNAQQKERRSTPEYKVWHKGKVVEWRERNPEKWAAQVLAMSNKKNIKKSYCESCLNEENLQMHHPDYSKPLEVITLCVQCHSNIHHNATLTTQGREAGNLECWRENNTCICDKKTGGEEDYICPVHDLPEVLK